MPSVGSKWFPDTPEGHREAQAYSLSNPDAGPMREGTGAHVYQSVLDRESERVGGFDKQASAPAFQPGTIDGFFDELEKISKRVK